MTDEEFKRTLADLADITFASAITTAMQKWNSGAINKAAYEPDDFLPAKACLSSAMKDVAMDIRPLSDEGRELTSNLSHF